MTSIIQYFLIGMFFITEDTDIASYADDNTPYVSADNINGVVKSLEEAIEVLFKWFNDNLMKIVADKCYLLLSTNNTISINIGNFDIANSQSEKLLRVKFDHKFFFDYLISELSKKVSGKIHALPKVTSHINISKRSIFMNAFLNHNLVIVPLYECVIFGPTIAK